MQQSLNRYFKEALNEFEQIETLLLNKDKRDLSQLQIGIMVRKRFSAFTGYLNSALNEPITMEDRVDFYQKLLPRINTILCSKPEDNPELFWYQLESIRYSFIANVMASWGKAGLLRTIGTAQALSNILMGLDIIDCNEILVEPDHPEFLSRNSLAINLNNFYAGVHYIAATNLYSIAEDNLVDWSMKALVGNQKMFDIIKRVWDIPLHLSFDEKLGENKTYSLCAACIGIFNSMIRYLILLMARYDNSWPKLDEQITFLNPENYQTMIASLESIIEKRDHYIADLQKHIDNGSFDSNNPNNSSNIQLNLVYSKLYSFIVKGIRLSFDIIQNNKQMELFNLKQNIEDFIAYYKSKKEQIMVENFLNSNVAENLVSILEVFFYQLAVFCYANRTAQEFDVIEETFEIFFTEEGSERFPHLHSLYLTGKLFVLTELFDKKGTYETACDLAKVAPQSLFQPRDSVSLLLLAELTKLSMNKIQLKTFVSKISKQINYAKQFLSKNFAQQLEQYVQDIQESFANKTPITTKRTVKYNPFDPYSFLLPDLELFFDENDLQCINYLPYNLASDSILK